MLRRRIPEVLPAVLGALLARCAPAADAPLSQPTEVMVDAWGPFAQQCTSTRISYNVTDHRSAKHEVTEGNKTCTGFSALPNADGSVEITASTSTDGQSSAPIISRFLRRPSGVSRIAAPGDLELLAQGSDVPAVAERLSREIGVPARYVVMPHETLLLPFHLDIPSMTEATLSCHPDGPRLDRGRQGLVFSCAVDQHLRTDRLDARLHLDGKEEIDISTGVRLAGVLSGWLTGRQRFNDLDRWQPVDDHIRYRRMTEFETSPTTIGSSP
jgi:hypothetical protein